MAALGERASRGKQQASASMAAQAAPISESVLGGLLDQYSEKLLGMLDERIKLRLSEMQHSGSTTSDSDSPALLTPPIDLERERPRTAGGG